MRHAFIPYAIAFRVAVLTGAGAWPVRRGAWLRLESEDGFVGLGEAAPLERLDCAEAAAAAVDQSPYRDTAFELASLDIEGQRAGKPIAALFGGSFRASVECNALCFAGDVEAAGAEAEAAIAQGFRTLKLKVGAASAERDIERVAEVRRRIGPVARIRIDANGAWDEATACRVLRAIERYDIEYAEDPVAGDASTVRAKVGIPIADDVRSMADGWRVVRARSADLLVLKPMALGGMRATRELALAAIDANVGVVITSVFDTAVGVAGALHLAASLPGPARAHGLATVSLLEDAPLDGLVPPHSGQLRVPGGPGLGVVLRSQTPVQPEAESDSARR